MVAATGLSLRSQKARICRRDDGVRESEGRERAMRSIQQLMWWVIPAVLILLVIAGPYVMIGFGFGVGIIYAVRNFRSL